MFASLASNGKAGEKLMHSPRPKFDRAHRELIASHNFSFASNEPEAKKAKMMLLFRLVFSPRRQSRRNFTLNVKHLPETNLPITRSSPQRERNMEKSVKRFTIYLLFTQFSRALLRFRSDEFIGNKMQHEANAFHIFFLPVSHSPLSERHRYVCDARTSAPITHSIHSFTSSA